MTESRTTRQIIAAIREKPPLSYDVALLCDRAENLVSSCIKLEGVLHEAAKDFESLLADNKSLLAKIHHQDYTKPSP